MAEASMIGVFNAKVGAFNEAVNAGDADSISSIGVELLKIALEECAKSNVTHSVKDMYRKQGILVATHMGNLGKNAAAPTRMTEGDSGSNESLGDPYYVPKQWFSDDVPNLNFTNIIGVQEVKDAFMVDVVAPLRPEFREAYRKFRGDQMGTQLLLYGPPGTGKTHIVKCLAGALNCKIAVVQASEVLASVVGIAEKNIRDVFNQAAELDRCIIFIDEIDSLCSDRSSDDSRNTKSVLTTLLTCMNGFVKNKRDGQLRIIIAATNLPWKLDSALKRGERFETQIYVPLPDERAREKFISRELDKLPHSADVTVKWLAKKLDGYSGADITAVMRQIAKRPLRRTVIAIMGGRPQESIDEKVTLEDCNEVIKSYINSITPEMLLRFEAYNRGIPYEELLKITGGQ